MGRHFAQNLDGKPGEAVAGYLRGVCTAAGLTMRQIANHARLSHNAVSMTMDGRLAKWETIDHLIRSIADAAGAVGRAGDLPADFARQTRALWDACDAARRRPAEDSNDVFPELHASAAPEVRAAQTIEELLKALNRFVLANRLDFNAVMLYRFSHVELDLDVVDEVVKGRRPLTRDLVGAIVAACDGVPTEWEAAYEQIRALELDRAATPRTHVRPDTSADDIALPRLRPGAGDLTAPGPTGRGLPPTVQYHRVPGRRLPVYRTPPFREPGSAA